MRLRVCCDPKGPPKGELGLVCALSKNPCPLLTGRGGASYVSLINIEALCAAPPEAAPPEALAHSPSQMPLSCPVVPPKTANALPSQREQHKDGGGGGGGVARRARAARAPKAKSFTTSSAAPSKAPCAASLTCWRRRRRWRWWCGRGGSMCRRRRAPVHAPGGRRGGPRKPVRRHWMMAMGKINTFTPLSCAASFTRSPFTCRPPLSLGCSTNNRL